jgi:hypothetical protein
MARHWLPAVTATRGLWPLFLCVRFVVKKLKMTHTVDASSTMAQTEDSPSYYGVRLVSFAILGYMMVTTAATCVLWLILSPRYLRGGLDFRAFYSAGEMARTGHGPELYNYQAEHRLQDRLTGRLPDAVPFTHPAYESLLFGPISLLSYHAAYFAFLGLNLLILAISFAVIRPRIRRLGAVYRWLPAASCLGFLPVTVTLLIGQDAVLLLLVLLAVVALLEKGKERLAGLALGLGVFRFQVVLPIALLYLVWRRWKFITGFIVSASAAAAISIGLLGSVRPYLETLLSLSAGLKSAGNMGLALPLAKMPNLRGLVFGFFGEATWTVVLTALGSIVILGIATRAKQNRFAIAIVAALLVSYHSFIGDMVVLLIPMLAALDRSIPAQRQRDRLRQRVLLASATLLYVSPLLLFYSPDRFYFAALAIGAFFAALMLEPAEPVIEERATVRKASAAPALVGTGER